MHSQQSKKKTRKKKNKEKYIGVWRSKDSSKINFLKNLPQDIPFTPTEFQKLWPKEILINSFVVQNLIFVCCRLVEV
jgi:hypothetical protein